ncbi:B9 protein family domain-containing protein [Spironucleus salmonicida]|uniref:B9 domain-containing protein 2 n=1 Tax=Spironucleus salmonicida TaxID=348837 RepID=V6M7G0_9EUKA|nr:B9 protein family domain-containing protein [Spironucleus salmonicida]|eukprot:EST49379.1 B9 protein family domain-containing protein [Spironucleus salmonicida]
MADLFIIGQIIKGVQFTEQKLSCQWSISTGIGWSHCNGDREGQSSFDQPADKYYDGFIFSLPMEVHFQTITMSQWPEIQLQLFTQDKKKQKQLIAQGSCFVPFQKGNHELKVQCWKHCKDKAYIEGSLGTPQDGSITGGPAPNQITEPSGYVLIELNVCTNGFAERGIGASNE